MAPVQHDDSGDFMGVARPYEYKTGIQLAACVLRPYCTGAFISPPPPLRACLPLAEPRIVLGSQPEGRSVVHGVVGHSAEDLGVRWLGRG